MTMYRRPIAASLRLPVAAVLIGVPLELVGGCLDLEPTPGDPLAIDDAGTADADVDAGRELPSVDADLSAVEIDQSVAACADELGGTYPDSRELFVATEACVVYAGKAVDACAAQCAASGGVPESTPPEGGDDLQQFPCRICV